MLPQNDGKRTIESMKIVILDGFAANPGDLEWTRLEKIGELTVYDRTESAEVVERSKDAEAVFTNKTRITAEDMAKLPELKFIGVLATGYNVVDVVAAREKGITVCNVPAYSTMSVAQNVFALILDITNSVGHYTRKVKEGKWSESEDFCFIDTNLTELAGKKMGIIGYGAIGKQVGRIAVAFGMEVYAHTSKDAKTIAPVVKLGLDDIFRTCDVVSLHCPLTETTFQLVNEERLALMKPSAILINTGRGPLVDENALAEALKLGKISAAGVDVLSTEPPQKDNPLLSAPNIKITPHISWATKEARKRLLEVAVDNLEAYLAGEPRNTVN